MAKQDKWLTIKIPRDLKKIFEKTKNNYPNFAQFTQFAIRKELEKLEESK